MLDSSLADKVEVLIDKKNDVWQVCGAEQLEPGDIFRMVRTDGTLVADDVGVTCWRAIAVPAIECEPVDGDITYRGIYDA